MPSDDDRVLLARLGTPDLTVDEVHALQAVFVHTGALEQIEADIARLVDEARDRHCHGPAHRPSPRLARRARATSPGGTDSRGGTRVDSAMPAALRPAISVVGLAKHYGSVQAVDGLSFDVARGEVFGLLGPNGAGKTTTVETLEGYRTPDRGHSARARPRPGCATARACGRASV